MKEGRVRQRTDNGKRPHHLYVHSPANQETRGRWPLVSAVYTHGDHRDQKPYIGYQQSKYEAYIRNQPITAHETESGHGVTVRGSASAPDRDGVLGLPLALAPLAALVVDEPLLPLPIVVGPAAVVPDEVDVALGMSDAGTAEIDWAAWAPYGGGQNVSL